MISVSVIINAFNYGNYLTAAIDSALHQCSPGVDLQVIVVDDGSTDHTPQVARQYGSAILYHRKTNGGQATAIQKGLELATGEIVCLLDADDEFYPTKIQRAVEAFQADRRIGAVYNSYIRVNKAGEPLGPPAVWNRAGLRLPQYGLFWQANGVPTSCISLRRDIARRLCIPDVFRICADFYVLAALPHLTEIGWVESPLTAYRIHGDNMFAGKDPTKQREALHRNWRATYAALLSQYNVELSKALFETQEHRDSGALLAGLLSCGEGLRYICRAEASTKLKIKESLKLGAALVGLYHPLTRTRTR